MSTSEELALTPEEQQHPIVPRSVFRSEVAPRATVHYVRVRARLGALSHLVASYRTCHQFGSQTFP